MKLTFKKEVADFSGYKAVRFAYRCLEKPEFTICADGAEWLAREQFIHFGEVAMDFPVGTEIAVNISYVGVNRPEVECSTCHGTGKVRGLK